VLVLSAANLRPVVYLQVLAKFLQHSFTQKIGIEFAAFCKFDNSLGNHFIGEIVSLGKLKSYARNFTGLGGTSRRARL
jgi:hypothetical protein